MSEKSKELFAQIAKGKEEISKIKTELREKLRNNFHGLTKELFQTFPELKSIGWKQYTPYFNDGDTCTFSANTDCISINGEYVDDSNWVSETNITNYGNWNRDKKVYEGRTEVPNLDYDSELVKGCDEISEFLRNFENDFYITRFGDHAQITVTKDGVDVDEYDHD